MKRNYLLLSGLFSFFSLFSQSPISLSNSNMPSSGDTLRYSNARLSSVGSYTQTGTNFSWNFSTLDPSSQGVRQFKAGLQTPYAFYFYNFNEYGEKIADTVGVGAFSFTDYYNFYKKQTSPSAFVADGVGITYQSVPVASYYSDKDELYNFPLTYPKYDSTTFRFSTPSNTQIPVRYSKTGYRVTVVDGWGTVTTPFGTANCLRLVTTQYSKDTVRFNNFPFGFTNNQRSYQWVTTTTKIPFLEISGAYNNGSFTMAQARYRDSARTIVGIHEYDNNEFVSVYPNPVRDQLFLSLPLKERTIAEVFNINGSLLASYAIEPNNGLQSIKTSELKTGVYTIKISNSNYVRFLKFVKE